MSLKSVVLTILMRVVTHRKSMTKKVSRLIISSQNMLNKLSELLLLLTKK